MGAGVEALALAALCSGESVWVQAGRERATALNAARARFACAEGDHCTTLSAFRAFERLASTAATEAATVVAQSAAGLKRSRDSAGAGGAVLVVAPAPDGLLRDGGIADADGAAGGGGERASDDDDASEISSSIDDVVDAAMRPWGVSRGASARRRKSAGGRIGSGSTAPVRTCVDSLRSSILTAAHAAASAASAKTVDPSAALKAARRAAADVMRHVHARLSEWTWTNFLSLRSLRTAVAVRDQLAQLVSDPRSGTLALSSCGNDTAPLRRALAVAWRQRVATRVVSDASGGARVEYRTAGGLVVSIHPSSILVLVHAHVSSRVAAAAAAVSAGGGNKSRAAELALTAGAALAAYPDTVVYGELVRTSRDFMRSVTTVDAQWVRDADAKKVEGKC